MPHRLRLRTKIHVPAPMPMAMPTAMAAAMTKLVAEWRRRRSCGRGCMGHRRQVGKLRRRCEAHLWWAQVVVVVVVTVAIVAMTCLLLIQELILIKIRV